MLNDSCSENNKTIVLLRKLEAVLGVHGTPGFSVGESLTLPDFKIFIGFTTMVSGFLDGVPKTILDEFPNIQAIRKNVGSDERLQKYYEGKPGPYVFLKSVAATIPE